MAQAIHRSETFTFTMSAENLVIQRGNLVYVQQDVAWVGGFPFRVVSVNAGASTVRLDSDVSVHNILPSETYTIRLTDGTIRNGTLDTSVFIDNYTVKMDSVAGVQFGNLIVLGMTIDPATRPYLVQTIVPEKDFNAVVTLVPYVPGIYTSDITTIPPWNGWMSERDYSPQP